MSATYTLGAHKYEKERGYGKPSVSNRYPELWRSVSLPMHAGVTGSYYT